MPTIAETKLGREIGSKSSPSSRFIWLACLDCGKERWVRLRTDQPDSIRCRVCSRTGANHPKWNGGHIRDGNGYIYILLAPTSFFYPMVTHDRYIYEHRLIMAKHLGRCLQKWEVVHHKNGIKNDNRIENLELSMRGSHSLAHNKGYCDGYRQGYLDGQNERIEELLKHIKLLELQVGERLGINY